ncbi:MAG: phosphoribosyltransferase [Candidatus Bathyarchaeia archaeon]
MKANSGFKSPSWDHIYQLLIEISEKIKRSGFDPDLIVGISRGGWTPARVLSDLLDNPNIASIRVEFYLDIKKPSDKPVITQPVSAPVDGMRVLVVDDVVDTGKSLKLVFDTLSKQANEVKTVALYCKPWSTFRPDFYARETEAWVIFPWERYETVKKLGNRMLQEGRDLSKIEAVLIEVGLEPMIVKRFVEEIFGNKR